MPSDGRCLCGLMDVITGTWIIVVIQVIFVSVSVFVDVKNFHEVNWNVGNYELANFVIKVIFLVAIILAIVALIQKRSRLMLMHLVISALFIIWYTAHLIWYIIEYSDRHSTHKYLTDVIVGIVVIAVLVYCLLVEHACYHFLSGAHILVVSRW